MNEWTEKLLLVAPQSREPEAKKRERAREREKLIYSASERWWIR